MYVCRINRNCDIKTHDTIKNISISTRYYRLIINVKRFNQSVIISYIFRKRHIYEGSASEALRYDISHIFGCTVGQLENSGF